MLLTLRPFSRVTRVLVALAAGLLGSCGSTPVGPDGPLVPGDYYTQYPMYMSRDTVHSTNYRGGGAAILLPVSTRATLVSGRGRRLDLVLDGGREIRFEHRPKDTNDTLAEAFAVAFAPQPIDLTQLTDKQLDALDAAQPEIGMHKDTILLVMGPPPARGTLGPDSNIWKYWEHGWNKTFDVVFDSDGLVSQILR